MDSIQDGLEDTLQELIIKKLSDSISELEFKKQFRQRIEATKIQWNRFLEGQMKQNPVWQDVKLRYWYTEIILQSEGVNDTIVSSKEKPVVFFGEAFEGSGFEMNNGNFYNTKNDTATHTRYIYWGKYTISIDIKYWRAKVMAKMMGILLAAAILILTVILVFSALLKQKKIAQVKTDFANNISHELKTPITSIGLVIKSLKKEEFIHGEAQCSHLIEVLERQNYRMRQIVVRVMESAMNIKVQKENTDVVKLLTEFLKDFNFEEHSVHTEMSPSELFLQTDAYQLQHILCNILENAVKYSSQPDTI